MSEEIFVNGLKYFIISTLVTIICAFLINYLTKRLINRFNKKYKDKITTNQYLYSTIRASVWIVSLIIIMRQIKPLNSLGDTLLGATSIIAIAIGIAAQATFGNYIAGFFLAVHQPFKVGDIIRIKEKNLSGTVQEITFRHTVLLSQEQTEIIIPNTLMNSVVIEDMSNGNYSELIELKVSGDTDLDKLKELINNILEKEELINNHNIDLVIKNISKDGYQVAFPIHTESLIDFGKVRNNILPTLFKALEDNNIKILN